MHLWREMADSVKCEKAKKHVAITVKLVNGTTNASWYYRLAYEYHIYPNGYILFEVLNLSHI